MQFSSEAGYGIKFADVIIFSCDTGGSQIIFYEKQRNALPVINVSLLSILSI